MIIRQKWQVTPCKNALVEELHPNYEHSYVFFFYIKTTSRVVEVDKNLVCVMIGYLSIYIVIACHICEIHNKYIFD